MDIENITLFRLAASFKPFGPISNNGRRLITDKQYGLAISPTKTLLLVPTVTEGAIWSSPERVTQALLLNDSVDPSQFFG